MINVIQLVTYVNNVNIISPGNVTVVIFFKHDAPLCCRIMLPAFNRDGDYCLSFNYNMNGWHINTLQVVKRVSSGHLVHLWSKEGNKGPQWHSAQVTANLYSSEQVSTNVDRLGSTVVS